MASFFQPANLVGPAVDQANYTHFKIDWSNTLEGHELTIYWYQDFVVALGSTAVVLGCLSLIIIYVGKKRRLKESLVPWSLRWTSRPFRRSRGEVFPTRTPPKPSESRIHPSSPKFANVKTFCVSEQEIPIRGFQSNFDLHVVGMTGEGASDDHSKIQSESQPSNTHTTTGSVMLSSRPPSSRHSTQESVSRLTRTETNPSSHESIDGVSNVPSTMIDSVLPPRPSFHESSQTKTSTIFYGALKPISELPGRDVTEKASHVNNLRLRQGFNGVVIPYNADDLSQEVNAFIKALRHQHVSVILMGDPDVDVVESVHFGLIDGLILRNASIFRNGKRRDFFRAEHVRGCVARCKRQVKTRPDFFLGFIELWNTQPSAATLRRAFKLADFFGAVVQAQAISQHNSRISMCLSGFDWLKRPEIVQTQKSWSRHACHSSPTADSTTAQLDIRKINDVIGSAESLLSPKPLPSELLALNGETVESVSSPDYVFEAPRRDSLWDKASCGVPLCQLGCYNLRDQITQEHYNRILRTQRDLKRLQMLHVYADIEILAVSKSFKAILRHSSYARLVQTLLDQLDSGHVRIYKGLDSGFSLPDEGGHIMGLSDNYEEDNENKLDVYISQKSPHDVATIWHVFLAHHGVPRLDRFQEELLFLPESSDCLGTRLPKSIQAELESCTEAEMLSLIEQIRLADTDHQFQQKIVRACSDLLIDESSREAWSAIHSRACLDDSLSIRSVLKMRLEFFAKQGAQELPGLDELVEFYGLLERKLESSLFNCDRQSLNQLSSPLVDVYNAANPLTPTGYSADLYGLVFFSALRKLAFEDVYLETTDRCPLFLQQHDQAGVFAELWVLGSQCEIYFGVLPRTLGEVIYERYHQHLTENPPPLDSWNGKDVFSAYSNSQSHIKVEGHGVMSGSGSPTELPGQSPGFRVDEPETTKGLIEATSQFGALSIFCLPAAIDVLLLTFLGRGLYLTAFMNSSNVVIMANYAILTALVMTGGVTGWVGSSGGFYLFSFAFDNMAHFMVQRFSAAFVLTTIVALCGFFAFGSQISWFSGFVFLIYLYALTTFLNLLGVFATMHRMGCPLTSGRTAMWKCIPVLFISPVLSSLVNDHDLLIYLLVNYAFIILLLITFRNLCHEWTTWLVLVPTTNDKDLTNWYHAKVKKETGNLPDADPSVVAAEARHKLRKEVHKFRNRNLFAKIFHYEKGVDPFVHKMAIGLPFALWLLEKESGGAELPETYTTTWFVQLELAYANQRQLMRGLKEHSSFITFRYSRYDLGQNIGLFLGALMDRWIEIAMSARSPPVVYYFNNRARYGLCWGLIYFLLGAVALDVVLQRCWPYTRQLPNEKLTSLDSLSRVLDNETRVRNKRYRSALVELLSFLTIAFGITTILLWAFVIEHNSVILYFTYISGYTGVLLFQFNRCFTKDPRAHVIAVLVCCLIGFLVGCILRAIPSTASFFFNYVIGLNTTTTLAAISTFFLTGYFPSIYGGRRTSKYQNAHPDTGGEKRRPTETPSRTDIWNSLLPCTGEDTLCNLTHKTHSKILQHLCLDINVNIQWSKLPEDVRRLILCRIQGTTGRMTPETRDWLLNESKKIYASDESLALCLNEYQAKVATIKESESAFKLAGSYGFPDLTSALERDAGPSHLLSRIVRRTSRLLYDVVKWTAIVSGAASDTNRELWFALRGTKLGPVALWIILKVWKLCWWVRNFWTYLILIVGKQSLSKLLRLKSRGAPRTLQGNTIVVETPLWSVTGFLSRNSEGNLTVAMFHGKHSELPPSKDLRGMATYDSSYRLVQFERNESTDTPQSTRTFHYTGKDWTRWPTYKIVMESGREIVATYDKYGRVVSGKIFPENAEFAFEFIYKKLPKGNTEILKATFTRESTQQPLVLSVFWSVQPRGGSENVKNWTASDKIQRVTAVTEGKTYELKWIYKHARDPDVETEVTEPDGSVTSGLAAPTWITEDTFGLLRKPKDLSFDQEDLLVYHPLRWLERFPRNESSKSDTPSWASWLGSMVPFRYSPLKKKKVYRKQSTSVIRTALWTYWAKPPYIDAVSACFLDEMILREEPLLQRYWRLRDAGFLSEAASFLDENLDLIISAIEPSAESSQTCPLLIKATDLFVMGLGKDANQVTARPEDAYRDTQALTSVIFSDNGCWPDNPGGVSNCRRDLVNGHTTIRGHCLAESANDFGLPCYQIERNINSLKILPLWGLDGKTPYHGVLDNLLQTQVDERIDNTRVKDDINGIFIPLLQSFVRGARMRRYDRGDLVTLSNVILRMNRYFEHCDFNKTWECEDVWHAWIEAWLIDYNDPNISNIRDFFEIEQPSMNDFRDALGLYVCYFFIYSVELPAECPTVFQSTHHGISSLYGMLLKYRRGTTWGIWDHAILWRETCLNISPAQCLLPVPVQSMLLAGIKLACHLAYTHVDIVLPCTSVFNPDWEIDLGTDQGLRGSKKLFARKVDPIVNGIGNMDAFQPVKETRSKFPTTVMLSNVQFIKDVKNAVLAADVIINKFGFDSYRLVVYGAQDRQPSYALETTTLINNRGLNGKVILAGFGSPKEVLKDAWLFMNSSLSEGLPLAIGEAALSGIPIVATEVGATALVLTDPDDPSKRYGEVVPPNDPEALARAQLSILSMLGPWAQYTQDNVKPPALPDSFSSEDVKWITQRMYDKADDRRALGLKLRDVVLRSFHGHRYLREHEQMYWIQRSWAETRRSPHKLNRHPPANAVFGESSIYEYDDSVDTGQDAKPRWQDFDLEKQKEKHQIDPRKYSIGTYEKASADR